MYQHGIITQDNEFMYFDITSDPPTFKFIEPMPPTPTPYRSDYLRLILLAQLGEQGWCLVSENQLMRAILLPEKPTPSAPTDATPTPTPTPEEIDSFQDRIARERCL